MSKIIKRTTFEFSDYEYYEHEWNNFQAKLIFSNKQYNLIHRDVEKMVFEQKHIAGLEITSFNFNKNL